MIAAIFDTETTDLISNHILKIEKQPEIWEFYACMADLSSGEILRDVDLLIKPSKKIDVKSKASKVTGVTNELLADAPPFANVFEPIKDILETAPVVIAHNLSFDQEVVDIEFERMGRKIIWPRMICTVEQTIFIKGYRLSLNDLHHYLFNEKFEGAHRAKVDVQALLRCCVELHQRGMI